MQITKVKKEAKFDPIEITLLIQSKDEYDAIREMTCYDSSIPSLLTDVLQRKIISKFLLELGNQLYS